MRLLAPQVELESAPDAAAEAILTVDVGSTFTKITAISLDSAEILARASSPTTVDGDLMEGIESAERALRERLPRLAVREVLGCSSAAGGLRVAVVGLERDLTARAARYAAMSAGARVVHVATDGLGSEGVEPLLATEPDIVLLTGGTDGGDRECLFRSACSLALAGVEQPVLVAGNAEAADAAVAALSEAGIEVASAANVLPEPTRLEVAQAREEIRRLFIDRVIGGGRLSTRPRFAEVVRMATPEAVFRAVELLGGRGEEGLDQLMVVDVGGATTDIHSYVRVPLADQGMRAQLAPEDRASRTVEADLGIRWSADSLLDAARGENRIDRDRWRELHGPVERLVARPAAIPTGEDERELDLALAALASELAVSRHAGRLRTRLTADGAIVESSGKDLRGVEAAIGTGGAFRRGDPERLRGALRQAVRKTRCDQLLPEEPAVLLDRGYVLAPAGLLSLEHEDLALALLRESFGSARKR